jgi:molybdopterin molybdotransferase
MFRLSHAGNCSLNTREFLGLDEALTLLRTLVAPLATDAESIPLASAVNRVVAETIVASMNVPPFNSSAMDGYAVCSSDPVFATSAPYRLSLQGGSLAGAPFDEPVHINHAVRIFTGAVVPARCDAVVIQEVVERTGDTVILQTRPERGANVRPAGHDVSAGGMLLEAGTTLGPFELAWLTACGERRVHVRPLIRLALFSTGDELRDTGTTLGVGQIYDANRFVLTRLLAPMAVAIDDLGILPDDPAIIETTLAAAAREHDVVLTSGGVSVGDADHVRNVVARLGLIEFWKIAIKPGKPLAYGRIGRSHFFGLPGNPVSTIVTFLLLVKPMLAQLAGARHLPRLAVNATLDVGIAHEPGRVEYQRGIHSTVGGNIHVRPTSDQSSNRLGSFYGANCLIEIPRESRDLARGDGVTILPLTGLLD